MKRIVLTSNTSISLYNFRLGLMKALKEKGVEVICVAPEDNYTEYLTGEFEFYPLRNLERRGLNPLKDLLLYREYRRLYKSLSPDLVLNFTIKPNIYSSFACGDLNIPAISVITGLGYVFIKGGLLEKLVRTLYKYAFRKNKFIVFQNEEDLNLFTKFFPNESKKFILIRGSGVNTEYFIPNCNQKVGERSITVFLFIGRFLRDKGILELIHAGERLWEVRKDFQIWLLGDIDHGNPASLKRDTIEKLKEIPFIRVFPFAKDVRPFICKADCVVLPSYREGLPRALLEGMAMERPIITTEIAGCKEVCKNGINGFLVKPGDIESLYQAMENFLDLNPEERKKMGIEGRKIVLENFDEKIIISKYLELIEEISKGTSQIDE